MPSLVKVVLIVCGPPQASNTCAFDIPDHDSMFHDMFLKIQAFELCDERPDHHDENKQAKPGIDDKPNRASAYKGDWFFQMCLERGSWIRGSSTVV